MTWMPVVATPDTFELPDGWRWWQYGHRPVAHPTVEARPNPADYDWVPPGPGDPQIHSVWVADETARRRLQGWLRDTFSTGLPEQAWDRVARCWHQLATYRPPYRLADVPVGCPGAVVARVRRYRPWVEPAGDPQHTDLVSDVALAVVRAPGGTPLPTGWQVRELAGHTVEVDGLWRAWLAPLGWDEYDADRAPEVTLADWRIRWQTLTGRVPGDGHARRR